MLSGDLIRALVSGEGEAYTSLSVSASPTLLLHKPSFLSVLVILIHSSHLNNSAFILHRVSLFQPCVFTHVVLRGNVRDGTRHRYSGSDRRQLRPHIRCVQHLHSSQSRYAPVPILSLPCRTIMHYIVVYCTGLYRSVLNWSALFRVSGRHESERVEFSSPHISSHLRHQCFKLDPNK
jgi:hypothetical protein